MGRNISDDNGDSGVVTDMTYSLFHANARLITSSIYHHTVHRWIPVLYTVCFSEQTEIYELHFSSLMTMAAKIKSPVKMVPLLVSQVVDFAGAQVSGFKQAYAKKMYNLHLQFFLEKLKNETIRSSIPSEQDLLEEASKLLQGCEFHFLKKVRSLSNTRAACGKK